MPATAWPCPVAAAWLPMRTRFPARRRRRSGRAVAGPRSGSGGAPRPHRRVASADAVLPRWHGASACSARDVFSAAKPRERRVSSRHPAENADQIGFPAFGLRSALPPSVSCLFAILSQVKTLRLRTILGLAFEARRHERAERGAAVRKAGRAGPHGLPGHREHGAPCRPGLRIPDPFRPGCARGTAGPFPTGSPRPSPDTARSRASNGCRGCSGR